MKMREPSAGSVLDLKIDDAAVNCLLLSANEK